MELLINAEMLLKRVQNIGSMLLPCNAWSEVQEYSISLTRKSRNGSDFP